MTDTAKPKLGRPKGSGPTARLRNALMTDERVEELVLKVYEQAKAGDMVAASLLLRSVWPPLRAQAEPVRVDLGNGTLSDKARALLDAAAAGDLPSDIASELIAAIGRVVQVDQADELHRRLVAFAMRDMGQPVSAEAADELRQRILAAHYGDLA